MNRGEFNLLGRAASATFFVNRARAQASWDEVLKAAESDGEVQVYATQSDLTMKRVAEGFMTKYPNCSAPISRIPGSPGTTKLKLR
jgi:hypothetical protein